MSRRVLIVDGYNLIRSTPQYCGLAEHDLDAARTALISDVAAFAQGRYTATVVFDGGGNPHSDGVPHDVAGVMVVFSPSGVDADSVVERLARQSREAGRETEVVTSDAQTQWAVMGAGVARRSSAEFGRDLSASEEEWREANPVGLTKTPVEALLEPDVRERLWRMAQGLG